MQYAISLEADPEILTKVERVGRSRESSAARISRSSESEGYVSSSGLFGHLSDYEILYILKTIATGDAANWRSIASLAQTCSRLNALAYSPQMWKEFVCTDNIRTDRILRAPYFQACEVVHFDRMTTSAERTVVVRAMPNLRTIRIAQPGPVYPSRRADKEGDFEFGKAVCSHPNVRHLDADFDPEDLFYGLPFDRLERLQLYQRSPTFLFDHTFPSLTSLTCSLGTDSRNFDCPNLRRLAVIGTVNLAPIFERCVHLEAIVPMGTCCCFFCRDFSEMGTVKPLESLRTYAASNADCEVLAAIAPNLVKLAIGVNTLHGYSLCFDSRYEGLSKLVHLEDLWLARSSKVPPNVFLELAGPACATRLRRLVLEQSTFVFDHPDFLLFLSSPCCSKLEVIDVDFITAECVEAISENCSATLRKLRVSSPKSVSLAKILAKCTALVDLALGPSDLSLGYLLGTAPAAGPIATLSATSARRESLDWLPGVLGKTLAELTIESTDPIDRGFLRMCPRLTRVHSNRPELFKSLPPWTFGAADCYVYMPPPGFAL